MPRKTAAQKAAEEAAAAEAARRKSEQQRLKWAAVVILALAVFASGYAIGQANAEDSSFARPVVFGDDLPPFAEIPMDEFHFVPDDPTWGTADLSCRIIERDGRVLRLECEGPGLDRIPADERPRDERPRDRDQVSAAGYLGVGVVMTDRGVVVAELADDGPAARAGIEVDDVIARFGDTRVESPGHLADLIAEAGAGSEVSITLFRFDGEVTVRVRLGERP